MTSNAKKVATGAAGSLAAALLIVGPIVAVFEGERRVGYLDIVGVPTYCYGGTGSGAVVGKRYTAKECRDQLADDVRSHAKAIAPCITRAIPAETHAAMISLSYNIGAAAFCRSTIARKLNAGDIAGACAGLPAWSYAKGRFVQGLANRRAQERALCERGLAHV